MTESGSGAIRHQVIRVARIHVALAVVGGKWKPLVLFHLGGGSRRFGELRRLVTGISEKVLIQQLKELKADGILSRTGCGELPPRVDYAMTAFDRTLATALVPMLTESR
jgi:DNA-binding HxlR family transcriptional regulator